MAPSSNGVDQLPDPPDAPEIRRRIVLQPYQRIGLPLLMIWPLLALLGVFGERRATARAGDGALQVEVRFPAVFRYKMLNAIDVHVTNRGSVHIDTLTVSLDTAYAKRFSTVMAVPPFTGSFVIDVLDLHAGEERAIRIELQAERYWRHEGSLSVAAAGDSVRVPLSTFIFP